MSLLTLELIGLFLAAWKTPAWVKEIGMIGLLSGLLPVLFGMYHAQGIVAQSGDVSPALLAGGFRVALITVIYGCVIFLISLVIRILQKPRLL
jgi:biopolymer transport protein ExbB/TolQ